MSIRKRDVHFSDWTKVRHALVCNNVQGITETSSLEDVRAFLINSESGSNPFYYYVCYIKDSEQIYTHGRIYDCSTFKGSDIKSLLDELTNGEIIDEDKENEIIAKLHYLINQNAGNIAVLESEKADKSEVEIIRVNVEENEEVTSAAINDLYNRIDTSIEGLNAAFVSTEDEVDDPDLPEMINVSLKTDQSSHEDLVGVVITISYRDVSESHAWNGSELTFDIPAHAIYTISVSDVTGYRTPGDVTNTAVSSNSRTVVLEYEKVVIVTSTIRLNMTITDPASMVTGDVNGESIQAIRSNSHRYLGKYTDAGQMTICLLDDSDSTKYFDGTTAILTGAQGDVFMRLPKFFYKATNVSTDIWDISFAYGGDLAPDATWKTWDGNDLIGAYEAYHYSYLVYSWSWQKSTDTELPADLKTYARNRGTGYSLVKWKHHSIMCFLFYALYGTTNSRAICGIGETSYNTTGASDSLGMEDTTINNGDSSGINFWGLENWWGNKYEYIDNVVWDSSTSWAITEDDGSTRSVAVSDSDGYISVLSVGESLDAIPLSVNGSETTGFCDSFYASEAGAIVVRDGAPGAGVASLTPSPSHMVLMDHTSRLAFRGELVEETNTITFRNIPIIN